MKPRSVSRALAVIGLLLACTAAVMTAAAGTAAADGGPEFVPFESTPSLIEGGPVQLRLGPGGILGSVKCTATSGSYSPFSQEEGTSALTFTGCKFGIGKEFTKQCTSAGKAAGEVEFGPFYAQLVYVSRANSEAGMLFNPGEGPMGELNCEARSNWQVTGALIARLTPIDTPTRVYSLAFNLNGKNEDEVTKYQIVGSLGELLGEHSTEFNVGQPGGSKFRSSFFDETALGLYSGKEGQLVM